jgi:predicted GH43/DUF377 family glycosyl hydrolase
MEEAEAALLVKNICSDFCDGYRNIESIFTDHFNLTKYLVPANSEPLSWDKKLLIGSYFTMEYSIEAAALFNPSIVEHPDQRGAGPGQKKVIISLRATGESHISSLVFRQGLLDENCVLNLDAPGKFLAEGIVTQRERDKKQSFGSLLAQIDLPPNFMTGLLTQLKDNFTYREIEIAINNILQPVEPIAKREKIKSDVLSLANTNYELHFPEDSMLSERVIFPVTQNEKNGIEDARFVKFKDDDGMETYIATYTAYDGTLIQPQLILTTDFKHFKIAPLHGQSAVNKNLALFPRKINNQYVMLSRIDGINNYIMFSDDLYNWETAALLQEPKYPWEFVQIGNAGSPIETDRGWLVITHGVGAMRKYCLGASLFKLDDPIVELGRLKQPLLVPNEDERDGYVPNVVYSCGALVHGESLILPYAVSDHASSYACCNLKELLDEIMTEN